MAGTMIITETIKYISPYINDFYAFICICIIAIIMLSIKLGLDLTIFECYLFTKPNIITLIGSIQNINGQNNLSCSKAFKSVNNLLITKYKINQLVVLKDMKNDLIIDEITNYKLDNDLILNVKKINEQIKIILKSNKIDLKKFVLYAIENDNLQDKNKLTIEGHEENGQYNYPKSMIYLTYVLINNYNMSKLKILNKNDNSTETIKKEDDELEPIILINFDLKNIFLLENCKDYHLENDIYLDIDRFNKSVIYTLRSEKSNLNEFFKKCMNIYKLTITEMEYNNCLKLIGHEIIRICTTGNDYNIITYSRDIIALNYVLIEKGYINNCRIVYKNTQRIKIIDSINNFKFENIILNVIKNIKTKMYETVISTTFILESNEVNLDEYILKCINIYENDMKKSISNTLYYFKYIGKIGNELKFTKNILSEPLNESYETFDNIFSEHTENIKKDIIRLKDNEYYKRTGMRRKKSYLFYGEPGTGKNAMVTAMALFDSRHIIDVPFDKIKTNTELEQLMNLKHIEGTYFSKDQIIIMFDEIHIGLQKINENNNKKDKEIKIMINELIETNNINNINNLTINDEINMGNILSLFDGSHNYKGIIFVGLTNYFDKIYEPLKRENRLTPKYFTFMRKIDIINLLEKFFQIKLNIEQINLIPDRKIIPALLRLLCELYQDQGIDVLINNLI
jgi:hypothetical protein